MFNEVLTETEIQVIFSKISFDPVMGCWNWIAAKNRGYGAYNYRGKTAKIHRLLYEAFRDKLPKYEGVNVLDHVVCDNPGCCNPWHVELTKQSNNVLRANSIAGVNKRKTRCNKGHEFSTKLENYGKGKLGRRCTVCRAINANRRYHLRMGHIKL